MYCILPNRIILWIGFPRSVNKDAFKTLNVFLLEDLKMDQLSGNASECPAVVTLGGRKIVLASCPILATVRHVNTTTERPMPPQRPFTFPSHCRYNVSCMFRVTDEPEDVDRLLWCCPPQLSADDGPSFEFEFADQPLPDVYKLPADGDGDATPADEDGDGDAATTDDWVLFSDVSAALSVKTADALAKLLDVENAVTAVPLDRFNERAVPRKTLGRQPAVVAAANKTVANKTAAEPSATTTTSDAAADEAGADGTEQNAAAAGEQILLVRFDHKLKQLLGVDAYSVS